MRDVKLNEIVNATITGARVQGFVSEMHGTDAVVLSVGGSTVRLPLCDEVTLEHVAPAEWPPRMNDLWRHTNGKFWFGERDVENVCLRGGDGDLLEPHEAYDERYQLTLVHREGNQRGPVVFEDPLTARLDEQGEVPL